MRAPVAMSRGMCVLAVSAVALLFLAPARPEPSSSRSPCEPAFSKRAALVRLYREHRLVVEGFTALLQFDPAGEKGPTGRLRCMYSQTRPRPERVTAG
jgi:hypothetical protein